MNWLSKLFSGTSPARPTQIYSFTVQCNRCGEMVEGRINLANDLSADYEGDRVVYHVRKMLMGSSLCFQRIEVELHFDASRNVVDRQISGGRFVENS